MASLKEYFNQFDDLHVMVIGDIMIDSYLWGTVNRISPEAPVPIVNVAKREKRLGGAANVALNLKAMGAKPHLIALIGDDKDGDDMLQLFKEVSFSEEGIFRSKDRPTTIKHRVIGGSQQLLRVDAEDSKSSSGKEREELKSRIAKTIDKCHAVIFEDYDKGVIDKELIDYTVELCRDRNIPVSVDPKKRNFLEYKRVDLFKPNLKETREGLNLQINPAEIMSLNFASEELRKHLGHKITLMTLSENGVYIDGKDKKIIPAHKREISDVSGAGDTVISVACLCLALKIEESLIAELSNLAGGQVCEHVGVVPVDKEQLYQEAMESLDLRKYGLDG